MSDQSTDTVTTPSLKELMEQSGLLDTLADVEQVEESMYRMRAGSAMLVVGIKGRALVIISPMFKTLPQGRELEFCYRLLQLNSTLGGIANFAVQPDGWVVMHGGRDIRDMNAGEFRALMKAVADAADYFDNKLLDEFYAPAADSDSAPADEEFDDGAEPTGDATEDVADAELEE